MAKPKAPKKAKQFRIVATGLVRKIPASGQAIYVTTVEATTPEEAGRIAMLRASRKNAKIKKHLTKRDLLVLVAAAPTKTKGVWKIALVVKRKAKPVPGAKKGTKPAPRKPGEPEIPEAPEEMAVPASDDSAAPTSDDDAWAKAEEEADAEMEQPPEEESVGAAPKKIKVYEFAVVPKGGDARFYHVRAKGLSVEQAKAKLVARLDLDEDDLIRHVATHSLDASLALHLGLKRTIALGALACASEKGRGIEVGYGAPLAGAFAGLARAGLATRLGGADVDADFDADVDVGGSCPCIYRISRRGQAAVGGGDVDADFDADVDVGRWS